MLNRTNLTSSALALSNGLNLGTRSLAANASVKHGDTTPRVRPSHHDVMREGMVWCVVFSMPKPRYAIPAIPGSFIFVRQRPIQFATFKQCALEDEVAVERKVSADHLAPSVPAIPIAAAA
jgi:hypothetical protein